MPSKSFSNSDPWGFFCLIIFLVLHGGKINMGFPPGKFKVVPTAQSIALTVDVGIFRRVAIPWLMKLKALFPHLICVFSYLYEYWCMNMASVTSYLFYQLINWKSDCYILFIRMSRSGNNCATCGFVKNIFSWLGIFFFHNKCTSIKGLMFIFFQCEIRLIDFLYHYLLIFTGVPIIVEGTEIPQHHS